MDFSALHPAGPSTRRAAADAAAAAALTTGGELAIPQYLLQTYWWAYVHPRAVRLFEREWLVNAILLGNYGRLRNACLRLLGGQGATRILQLACVYGNLSARLVQRLAPGATLDVVDIVPIQLQNLARKLAGDGRVALVHADTRCVPRPSASYDQVLLFFLLHEQPEPVRRATLAEALRLVRAGGRIVIADYHRPHRWHPLRPLLAPLLRWLEPYALDLWEREIAAFLPEDARIPVRKHLAFGGLYQLVVFDC